MPTTNSTHQYSFDFSGNRQSAVTPSQGTVNYTSNITNQYTAVTGDTPTHDANGNLTYLRGRTFTWDRSNRLRSNGNISYTYDALGRMVLRKNTTTGNTRRYTWSGWLMISEQKNNSSGTETEFLRYTWGADLTGSLEGAGAVAGLLMIEHFTAGNSTAEVARVHPDANGNTMGLTSDTGAVLTWYHYHPFGQIEVSGGNTDWLTRNRFTFSTKWQDPETGLYYYGYRWYDSVTGRWPSRDPIQENGGANLYAFVGNSSLNRWDKLGHFGGGGYWPGMDDSFIPDTSSGSGSGWSQAIKDLVNWLTGNSPGNTNYASGSAESGKMKNSTIGGKLRKGYLDKFKGKKCSKWTDYTNVKLTFGLNDFIKSIPNGRAHFVGSARGDAYTDSVDEKKCKVKARFVIKNTTHLKSALYHLIPNSWNNTNTGTPAANWTQTYTWEEEFSCKP